MLKFFLFISIVSFPLSAAKLLDKTVAIFNDQVISLSQIKRVRSNLDARRNIAPQIFTSSNPSNRDLARILLQRLLVRSELANRNFVVTDDQVEKQVEANNKRLGITRDVLLKFLGQNNFTFDEYFQLIKESMEHSFFLGQVIQPLISITDQEVKNEYYKNKDKIKSRAFKYDLLDFKIKKTPATTKFIGKYKDVIRAFRKSGKLPKQFASMKTQTMEDIRSEGVNKRIRKVLNQTPQGGYTPPILLGSSFHIFYIKNKSQDTTDDFESAKNRIRAKLFNQSLGVVTKNWYESEARKHYIKFFL